MFDHLEDNANDRYTQAQQIVVPNIILHFFLNMYNLVNKARGEGVIVCSSARLCVCLSVNVMTPETVEISSQNFQGIISWLMGRQVRKWLYMSDGDLMSLIF